MSSINHTRLIMSDVAQPTSWLVGATPPSPILVMSPQPKAWCDNGQRSPIPHL